MSRLALSGWSRSRFGRASVGGEFYGEGGGGDPPPPSGDGYVNSAVDYNSSWTLGSKAFNLNSITDVADGDLILLAMGGIFQPTVTCTGGLTMTQLGSRVVINSSYWFEVWTGVYDTDFPTTTFNFAASENASGTFAMGATMHAFRGASLGPNTSSVGVPNNTGIVVPTFNTTVDGAWAVYLAHQFTGAPSVQWDDPQATLYDVLHRYSSGNGQYFNSLLGYNERPTAGSTGSVALSTPSSNNLRAARGLELIY